MNVENLIRNWKLVFGNWKYFFLAFFVAVMFYSLNVLISSFGNLISFYSSLGLLGTGKFFITMFIGFYKTVEFHSFVSLLVISILFGMLFSLLAYKVKVVKSSGEKRIGFFATIGLFLGVLAPGCAACGIGLLSALGLGSAFLTFLPFDGLELSVIAIVILVVVVYKTSDQLTVCKIN
jgi:ABC-type antimicrobial peptide transport system permease subunit